MSTINWSNGQLITLGPGDTATAVNLNAGQLYALFFYNAAQNDAATNVSVVWSNSDPPVTVTVPGTTGNQGLAALCFVDGNLTETVSAAVQSNQSGAQVQAFIGSVKMPIDTTGINNSPLPADGLPHSFTKFTRYFATPASNWYNGQIQSNINQFISVQFQQHTAIVNIVNKLVDPSQVIQYAGVDTDKLVTINEVPGQTLSWSFQGNAGRQFVWINADSVQNSQEATITLQSLADLYAEHAKASAAKPKPGRK